jgi:hypothetical protein
MTRQWNRWKNSQAKRAICRRTLPSVTMNIDEALVDEAI